MIEFVDECFIHRNSQIQIFFFPVAIAMHLQVTGGETCHVADHIAIDPFQQGKHDDGQQHGEEERTHRNEGASSVAPEISPGQFEIDHFSRFI